MNTILTDDERRTLRAQFHDRLDSDEYSAAVEAAVLAKLARQEPAYWTRQRFGYEREFCEKPFTTDWIPLYAHPAPQQAGRQRVPDGCTPVPQWMKPHPKCDEACIYQCTEGFAKFPQCAAAPEAPAQADDLSINPVTLGRTPWAYGEAPANTRNSGDLAASAVDERDRKDAERYRHMVKEGDGRVYTDPYGIISWNFQKNEKHVCDTAIDAHIQARAALAQKVQA